jgi:DNA (cytosine-5)-methyltransferase 1
MDFHTIELFAGVGQLGEGLRAGLAYLGRTARPVAYVEREAYAASVLSARMQEGSLDAAPIWSDVTTLDARRWRGAVDCIVGGFPCQDLSLAGRRAGLDGKRSGLFFEICRIADDCGARFLFLENVAGIASATATVVDEAEGTLDERAASRALGELADLGWHAEWATLSASDVGASHGRSRWFCWAWRVGEPESIRRPARRAEHAWQQRRTAFAVPGGEVGHTGLQHQHLQQREDGAEHSGAGCSVADTENHRHQPGARLSVDRECLLHAEQSIVRRGTGGPGEPGRCCADVADADGLGRWPQSDHQQQSGGLDWRKSPIHGAPIFAPGPTDPTWPGVIQHWPHLAPALEPSFYRVVDGLAHRMDDCRPQRLKCCGNGVVAAQAAFAFVGLVRRMNEVNT